MKMIEIEGIHCVFELRGSALNTFSVDMVAKEGYEAKVFCRGCGYAMHDTDDISPARFCPNCRMEQ